MLYCAGSAVVPSATEREARILVVDKMRTRRKAVRSIVKLCFMIFMFTADPIDGRQNVSVIKKVRRSPFGLEFNKYYARSVAQADNLLQDFLCAFGAPSLTESTCPQTYLFRIESKLTPNAA